METSAEIQMGCSPSSYFKYHVLIPLSVLFFIFSLLLPLSPTPLTLLILVLSSVVLFISQRKKKGWEEHPNRPTATEIVIPPKIPQEKEKEETADHDHDLHQEATHAGSPDLLSDCEGVDVPSSTSNDDCWEADWSSFQCNIGSQIPPPLCSDGSISDDDDDSLIEIALPGRQYVVGSANGREELFWSSSPQVDFLIQNHHDGPLSTAEIDGDDDVNMEEDNLIEIDISAGSIKWPRPRMEIQA